MIAAHRNDDHAAVMQIIAQTFLQNADRIVEAVIPYCGCRRGILDARVAASIVVACLYGGGTSFMGGMASMVFIYSTLSRVRLTALTNNSFVLPTVRLARLTSGAAWNTSARFPGQWLGAC